jgi:hypothetical protein
MYAASEKRIAIIYSIFQKADKSVQAYRKSSELYEAALKLQPANHWVLTQFLSLAATPALATGKDEPSKLVSDYGRWWMVARQLAEWQLRSSTVLDRVWAHSTLAELHLLGAIYGGTAYTEAEATQTSSIIVARYALSLRPIRSRCTRRSVSSGVTRTAG